MTEKIMYICERCGNELESEIGPTNSAGVSVIKISICDECWLSAIEEGRQTGYIEASVFDNMGD